LSLSLPSAESTTALESRRVPRNRFADLTPCATFAPMHYEPGYAYPLIVWLHGPCGNEQQLPLVMPLISKRNHVGVAPRGTAAERSRRGAFCWSQAADGVEEAESRIFDAIGVAEQRFNIHAERVFLVGVGCGGTMALRVAWNHPQEFAGVATFGGGLPNCDRPFRHVNSLRHLPCFMATNRQSSSYPEEAVCRDLRLLHSAGCTVALRQYPGDDEVTNHMLADLNRWIMEFVCGPQA
jgi:phospholipase/carboxylesterase